ncbi:MAG: polyprenyl diphosphate synthase [Planctomycetota bacterium]
MKKNVSNPPSDNGTLWPDGRIPPVVPRHIAIIMDGNGRWAKKHGARRVKGHEAGADSIRDILYFCRDIGVRRLTLYAFSTENWKRSDFEIKALFRLLDRFLRKERDELKKNGVRLTTIGDIDGIPNPAKTTLRETIEMLAGETRFTLTLALNYGGRQEIARAAALIARKAVDGLIDCNSIDERVVSAHLWDPTADDPELLIRTSGEQRLSNFLNWQVAYSEIWWTDVLWPDFRRNHLADALRWYADRDRRFGGRKS